MKNTILPYLYRDADNYKQFNECVVPGIPTREQLDRIQASLDDGEYFVPEKVGLPVKRFEKWDEQSDHPFCEVNLSEPLEATDREPDVELSWEELAKAFEAAKGHWEENAEDMARHIVTSGGQEKPNGPYWNVSGENVVLLPDAICRIIAETELSLLRMKGHLSDRTVRGTAVMAMARHGVPASILTGFSGTVGPVPRGDTGGLEANRQDIVYVDAVFLDKLQNAYPLPKNGDSMPAVNLSGVCEQMESTGFLGNA